MTLLLERLRAVSDRRGAWLAWGWLERLSLFRAGVDGADMVEGGSCSFILEVRIARCHFRSRVA